MAAAHARGPTSIPIKEFEDAMRLMCDLVPDEAFPCLYHTVRISLCPYSGDTIIRVSVPLPVPKEDGTTEIAILEGRRSMRNPEEDISWSRLTHPEAWPSPFPAGFSLTLDIVLPEEEESEDELDEDLNRAYEEVYEDEFAEVYEDGEFADVYEDGEFADVYEDGEFADVYEDVFAAFAEIGEVQGILLFFQHGWTRWRTLRRRPS
eukprot:jgi/Tetstr1/465033/TSEL_009761.t1